MLKRSVICPLCVRFVLKALKKTRQSPFLLDPSFLPTTPWVLSGGLVPPMFGPVGEQKQRKKELMIYVF